MAVGNYTYANLKDQVIDPLAYPSAATSVTVLNAINRACRLVTADLDLRSAKRRAPLASKVLDDAYDYPCPSDLKGDAVIDLVPQANRPLDSRLTLVSQDVFDRKKSALKNLVAVSDDDLVRKLRLSVDSDDDVITVSTLDSLTAGGGTWALFGDAVNVAADAGRFVQGSGSVAFDISSAGGTTAGIQNASLDAFDVTDYEDDGSALVWAYINTVADTGTDGLTNFILRIGNDSSNYHAMTVTTTNEGAAFAAGWNLLRFDFSGKTTTGTVTASACDYVALYMTKETGKADDGYRLDHLTLHTGEHHDLVYYSKHPWQTAAGAHIENSATSTDLLNADADELELFVMRGKVEVFRELKEYEQMRLAREEYALLRAQYRRSHRSERAIKQVNYY